MELARGWEMELVLVLGMELAPVLGEGWELELGMELALV
jgi:hypothetical protein